MWKADNIATVGACIVGHGCGGLGAGMDVVDGMHVGEKGLLTCLDMPEHFPSVTTCYTVTETQRRPGAQIWVGSSQNWPVFPGNHYHGTPREGSHSLSMAALHGAPHALRVLQQASTNDHYCSRIDMLLLDSSEHCMFNISMQHITKNTC